MAIEMLAKPGVYDWVPKLEHFASNLAKWQKVAIFPFLCLLMIPMGIAIPVVRYVDPSDAKRVFFREFWIRK